MNPIRRSTHETVESLTLTPHILSRNSPLSESVANGRCSRSSSKGYLTSSSVWAGAEPLLRNERASLVGRLVGVALDRGEAQGEGAGDIALAQAVAEGFDYLLAQVLGIRVRSCDATESSALQTASHGEP